MKDSKKFMWEVFHLEKILEKVKLNEGVENPMFEFKRKLLYFVTEKKGLKNAYKKYYDYLKTEVNKYEIL